MAKRQKARVLSTVSACIFWASLMLYGQQNVGRIAGVVRDPSGASVPKADITVTAVATSVSLQVQANEDGAYAFPSLPVGEYSLTVRAAGFKSSEHSRVQVSASRGVVIDFQLELGQS